MSSTHEPRCICQQLKYAYEWDQELSEVPVFTFDGETDYSTVIRHDSRCPARPLPAPMTEPESVEYAHRWVQDFIAGVVRPFEEKARAAERERIRLDMLADADTCGSDVAVLALRGYASKLKDVP